MVWVQYVSAAPDHHIFRRRAHLQSVQEAVEGLRDGVALLCSRSKYDILKRIGSRPDQIFRRGNKCDAVEVFVDLVSSIIDLVCRSKEGVLGAHVKERCYQAKQRWAYLVNESVELIPERVERIARSRKTVSVLLSAASHLDDGLDALLEGRKIGSVGEIGDVVGENVGHVLLDLVECSIDAVLDGGELLFRCLLVDGLLELVAKGGLEDVLDIFRQTRELVSHSRDIILHRLSASI